MQQRTFDMVLWLTTLGYEVGFRRSELFRPAHVLEIHLRKGDNHVKQLVDISDTTVRVMRESVDELISRTLRRAEWEFEYEFEKEKTKC